MASTYAEYILQTHKCVTAAEWKHKKLYDYFLSTYGSYHNVNIWNITDNARSMKENYIN